MNWQTFLEELRSDLQDTGTTPRWTSDILYLYFKDAVRDYSSFFPIRKDQEEIVLTNSRFALPSDFIEEIFVESPIGTLLDRITRHPGLKVHSGTYSYSISGGAVVTTAPQIWLTYLATHPVPNSKDDFTFVITVPDMDVELLRLYIKAKVYSQMRSRQASLDRFKLGSGSRDDNPLQPETDDLMEEYRTKIASRIRVQHITLYRRGRYS